MTFRASMLLTADAKQAKAELRSTQKEADGVSKATRKMGREGDRAAREIRELAQATGIAEDELRRMSAAERQAAVSAQQLGDSSDKATHHTGNLMAQWNDIGMMMAAGQNPFHLALQQGTQVNQVLDQMRSKGTAIGPALRTSFMSMLNPMNLVTLGAIAAGAALTQWLFDAGEGAKELVELISEAGDAIEAFDQKAERATLSTAKMLEEFGTADPILKAVLQDMAGFAKIEAYEKIDAMTDSLQGFWKAWGGMRAPETLIGEFLGKPSHWQWDEQFRQTVADVKTLTRSLSEAEDPADKLRAAIDLREVLIANLGPLDQMTAEQSEFYQGIAAIIRDLKLMGVEVREFEQAQSGITDEWVKRIIAERERAEAAAETEAWARKELATLQEQAELARLIAEHGAHSAEVAEFRAAAERRVYEEALAAEGVSEEMKQELLEAWDAGEGIAGSDIAGGISPAANEAARLAENLGISLQIAQRLAANAAAANVGRGRGGDPRQFGDPFRSGDPYGFRGQLQEQSEWTLPTPRKPGGGGGGRSAAKSLDREREAVERLLARERERLALQRETDPVVKEMIRHRETMANATDEERAALEELIRQRHREAEALNFSRDAAQGLRNAIDEVLLRGGSLGDMLADMLYKAAMWGDGPLGGLFGGSGLMDLIFPDMFADGGYLTGDGGPRQDKKPIMASPGEFMVNAAATSRYRHLLEHINSGGDVGGYASGGAMSGGIPPAPKAPAQARQPGVLRVILSKELEAQWLQKSADMQVEMLSEFERNALPQSVKRINDDPRRYG